MRNVLLLTCLALAFGIGWCGRAIYVMHYAPVEQIPAPAQQAETERVYPYLPGGAVNDLREN